MNSRERLIHLGKPVCNQNQTRTSLLVIIWWSHTILFNHIIFSSDHQTPSFDPSYLGTISEGILASTANFFPMTEELEGPLG